MNKFFFFLNSPPYQFLPLSHCCLHSLHRSLMVFFGVWCHCWHKAFVSARHKNKRNPEDHQRPDRNRKAWASAPSWVAPLTAASRSAEETPVQAEKLVPCTCLKCACFPICSMSYLSSVTLFQNGLSDSSLWLQHQKHGQREKNMYFILLPASCVTVVSADKKNC